MNKAMKPSAFLLSLVLSVVCLAGCHTSRPSSASFASVVIENRTPDQIRQTAVAVFAGDGYRAASLSGDELVFEKEGTRGDQIAYGSIVGDQAIRVRVRTVIVPLAPQQHRLQCKAYMVREAGTSFEDEVRLKNFRSGPYQKLLEEVAVRLK